MIFFSSKFKVANHQKFYYQRKEGHRRLSSSIPPVCKRGILPPRRHSHQFLVRLSKLSEIHRPKHLRVIKTPGDQISIPAVQRWRKVEERNGTSSSDIAEYLRVVLQPGREPRRTPVDVRVGGASELLGQNLPAAPSSPRFIHRGGEGRGRLDLGLDWSFVLTHSTSRVHISRTGQAKTKRKN